MIEPVSTLSGPRLDRQALRHRRASGRELGLPTEGCLNADSTRFGSVDGPLGPTLLSRSSYKDPAGNLVTTVVRPAGDIRVETRMEDWNGWNFISAVCERTFINPDGYTRVDTRMDIESGRKFISATTGPAGCLSSHLRQIDIIWGGVIPFNDASHGAECARNFSALGKIQQRNINDSALSYRTSRDTPPRWVTKRHPRWYNIIINTVVSPRRT
ncbi:hypothetical protein C8R43DRAFT_953035 [Mycena crocata]|nr:hypothetical protein C8R43DRAFT_953035 [Mycena crocata]